MSAADTRPDRAPLPGDCLRQLLRDDDTATGLGVPVSNDNQPPPAGWQDGSNAR